MKNGTIGHTKMKRLCRRLNIRLYQGVGIMEMLWDLTSRQAPRGDIGRISDEDIALALDFPGDEHQLVQAIADSGWLDSNPEHRWLVHDWWDHAEDGVHMKLGRSHQFFADGRAPKLSRLGQMERPGIERFYASACAQTTPACAQTEDSARQPPPTPTPTPVSSPPPLSVAIEKQMQEMRTDDFPETTITCRNYFPSTPDKMVIQIVVRAVIADPKIDDHGIAQTLCEAFREDQFSANLFLTTVPRILRQKISGKDLPPPKPAMTANDKRREETRRGLEVLDGIRRRK